MNLAEATTIIVGIICVTLLLVTFFGPRDTGSIEERLEDLEEEFETLREKEGA